MEALVKRKGAIVAVAPEADLKVLEGEPALRKFQSGKKVAEHFFCGDCGIFTHSHRRSADPNVFDFNSCLGGVDPDDLGNVRVADGVVWEGPFCRHR